MKSNELRIGNYVDFCGISKILELHSEQKQFDNVYLECEESFEWGEYEKLKPIPLTEEWLLKFGFEKGSNIIGDCYYIERDFGVSDFVLNITKTSNFEIYELDLKIYYVHQLQNLYFALTGEELNIKL